LPGLRQAAASTPGKDQFIVMNQEDDLAALLARLAEADQDAFDPLYHATSAKLFGVLVRILRRHEVAEEVLQDVYVSILERAASFDPARGSAMTWMATLARNRALDEVRREGYRVLEHPGERGESVCDEDLRQASAEQRVELGRLIQCLSRLDARKREIVLLAYRDGLTRAELAARYECPEGTIKTWLRRSLATLRNCLDS
jgi:RNA polymerase sigma-70 factor (ECF subfamily)